MSLAAALIAGTVLAWGLMDVWFYVTGRRTITAEIRDASKRWPLVPFVAGVLVGHWWAR